MEKLGFLCLIFILISSNLLFAQNNELSNRQIKFYFNYINDGYVESKASTNRTIIKNISKVGVPSIAYAWQTDEKKWQEIEIAALFENNQDVSIIGNNMNNSFIERLGYFSMRYERNRILLSSAKVDLSLGGNLQALYIHNSFAPTASSDFPFYYNGLHTKLGVVPRVLFKFNRYVLDFNMPFSVMHLNYNTFREENPTLLILERSQNSLNYLLFPNSHYLQARVGLAFNLNSPN